MRGRISGVALLVLILLPNAAPAQWALDGSPVTTVAGDQYAPSMVPDGAGGVIICWTDWRVSNLNIYAQRLDERGEAMWAANGVVICNDFGDQSSPVIASDGGGGAIIAWQDTRALSIDIYAQRVNAAGVVQWAANGVPVCTAGDSQWMPRIVSDGAGGAVVAWSDFRSATNYDLYAQRVNGAGTAQWAANGVLLCPDNSDQDSAQIISDGSGGAIVVWRDFRYGPSDTDILAQRINGSGVIQWSIYPTGVPISLGISNQANPQLVADGAGGAIIVWESFENGFDWSVYAEHVNSAGNVLWLPQVAVSTAGDDQRYPSVAPDGAGGAVVSWHDYRSFLDFDIYAQRVSATGAPHWAGNGVPVCTASGGQVETSVAFDGAGGFIVSWLDDRNGIGSKNIFAQRLSGTGAAEWLTNGVSVSGVPAQKNSVRSIEDGAGGTILAWVDQRSFALEIYAQRVENTHGFWGHPEPVVESVADVPHDQGGRVAVNWTASGRDLANPRTIDFYSVWRAVDVIPSGVECLSSDELQNIRPDDAGPVFLATPGHYFERIGTQSAHGWPGYSFAASTRADSVAAATGDELFMVAAHYVYDTFVAFASNEMSGHSVDNLAPPSPLFLTAQRAGADVLLHWNRVAVADLRDYSLYRATSSGVTPVPIHFLASSDDTVAIDPNAPTSALYYIVTAYDVHANQSDPSNEASVSALTGVGGTPALTGLTVLQNHPNPFGATTELEVGLPGDGDVRVEVFDVAGRRVSAQEVRGVGAGWQRIPFAGRDDRGRLLASGVYFYRVTAAGTTVTRKMVIAR